MKDLEAPGRTWNFILTGDRSRHTRADVFEAATYADRVLKAGADVVYCAENKTLSGENPAVWAIETHQKHAVLEQISHDTLRGMLAQVLRSKLEAIHGVSGPRPRKNLAQLREKLTVLERLDARDRAKIGMEDEYQLLKAEIAEASAIRQPMIDEIVGWLRDLSKFDELSSEDRKAALARIVDRIVLRFERKKVGARERSVFVKGTLEVFPLPKRNGGPGEGTPSFRTNGSGGPFRVGQKVALTFGPSDIQRIPPPEQSPT